ncbi:MAG: 16S rRNA (cytosine(1402)-N(4))-methyltransferase RsmH [Planctomycetota bacterium]
MIAVTADPVHLPVLLEETLATFEAGLGAEPEGLVVDATVGAGGHASALLERFEGIELLGLDWDPESLREAAVRLERFGARATLDRSPFGDFEAALERLGGRRPIALLADLGVCSLHLDRPERGFSFQADGPLDMRMNPDASRTAAEIVNEWSEEQLANLFFEEGGERRSRRAAAAVVTARRRVPFQRTAALADVIEQALGPGGKTHPATRCFQALRRAVNDEGPELEAGLAGAERALLPNGLLCLITFHSGEDGVVKRYLRDARRAGVFAEMERGAVAPERSERRRNRRARSARLRSALRTEGPARGIQGSEARP